MLKMRVPRDSRTGILRIRAKIDHNLRLMIGRTERSEKLARIRMLGRDFESCASL